MNQLIEALHSGDHSDILIDNLFDYIDDLLLAGKFEECDQFFRMLDVDKLETFPIVALLTITLPARQHLKYRVEFLAKARERLKEIELDRLNNLLSGLD